MVDFVSVDDKYLAWLYIDPSHYGRGIGRELLKIGVREIGAGAWTIVLDGNQKAIFMKARAFKRPGALQVITQVTPAPVFEWKENNLMSFSAAKILPRNN